MELKSYQEIITYLTQCEISHTILKNYLKDRTKSLYCQMDLRINIRKIKNNVIGCKEKILQYTSFELEDFLNFITEYLSITEAEEIIAERFVKDYREDSSRLPAWICLDLTEIDYLICNKESLGRVKEQFENNNLLGAIIDSGIKKYVAFPEIDVQLSDGLYLKKEFKKFPSLQIAFERLIDLGLQNPEMTSKERLDKVLEETRQTEVKRNLTI